MALQALHPSQCSISGWLTRNLIGSGAPAFLRLIFRVRCRPFTPAAMSRCDRFPASSSEFSSDASWAQAPKFAQA